MGAGILIDYNDGRPVMEITAGLKAPSFCTTFSGNGTGKNQFRVDTPLTTGSTVVLVPYQTVEIRMVIDNQVTIFTPVMMDSFTRNGDSGITITGQNPGDYNLIPQQWSGAVMEVLPAGSYNAGLLVSDSTDFTAISNNAKLMTCVWSGSFTVSGNTPLPVAGVPFGKWDNPNVSIGFDGTNLTCRDTSYTGNNDLEGSATINLVIFANVPPTAGPGITMTNSAGQVTFSTNSRPFILGGQVILSNTWQSIGDRFCQICNTGSSARNVGGKHNIRTKAVMMTGGQVKAGLNRVISNQNLPSLSPPERDINMALPLALLPNMY